MTKFVLLATTDAVPEPGAPARDRLLAGDPKFLTWNVEEQPGGLYAGVWEATPGKWRVEYDEWEYCRILSGVSIISEDGGRVFRVAAGDSFIIRPGFKGTWEVVETTRKEYVIRCEFRPSVRRIEPMTRKSLGIAEKRTRLASQTRSATRRTGQWEIDGCQRPR